DEPNVMLIATRHPHSATASIHRRRRSRRVHARYGAKAINIGGTSDSWVSVFAKNRVRQTRSYRSPRSSVTAAASRKEEKNGAASPAQRMNVPVDRSESNVMRPRGAKRRMSSAAISASLQLVANTTRLKASENAGICAARWAGSAAKR